MRSNVYIQDTKQEPISRRARMTTQAGITIQAEANESQGEDDVRVEEDIQSNGVPIYACPSCTVSFPVSFPSRPEIC